MGARAAKAEATRERILAAAALLMKSRFRSDIRIEDIAAAAGVTSQTVINVFKTKAALLDEALRHFLTHISAARRRVPPEDTEGAIRALVEHYEDIGDLVVRNLAEEADPELLAIGRQRHKEWVEIYFGDKLAAVPDAERQRRTDSLAAACDVYVWKLLRRDMGRSAREVEEVVLTTVRALMGAAP